MKKSEKTALSRQIVTKATAAVLLIAGVFCAQDVQAQGKKKAGMPQIPTPTVGVAKVTEAEDVIGRHYVGQVIPIATVNVTAHVSGEILEVGFADGAYVKAGQVLYKLDAVQYDAAVKSCKAKIVELKAKYDYAEKCYNRNDQLYTKKAVSQDSLESTQAAMKSLKAQILAAEAELIKAEDDLKDTTITAPIDGVIGVTKFTKGNYVTPGSGTLVTIVQVEPIRVRFAISSADMLNMFKSREDMLQNTRVAIQLSNGAMLDEKGRIEFRDNQMNSKTDAILLYANFKNVKHILYPGMTLRVFISKNKGRKLPAIIPSAMMHDAHGSCVYVLKQGNVAEKRYVVPGNSDGDVQLIEKGLKAGETVIIKGTNKVFPGMPVNPVTEK